MHVWITLAFLALCSFAAAQAPKPRNDSTVQNLDFCELIHHPQKYDGHMVRVHGHVVFEFEDFTLDDSGCSQKTSQTHEPGVWLTFGGSEPEIATFCCGSVRRSKGSNFEVAGHQVGLVRDANFRLFLNQISARRLRRPDGQECYDQCKFYHVTATLTGLFASATDKGGYGHFGMFHLLAIQRVSQVSAERTLIPFGGTYHCQKEKWEPEPDLMLSVAKSLECGNWPDGDCEPEQRFKAIAAHWNDSINRGFQTEVHGEGGETVANWVSSDLLTSYFTQTSRVDGHVSVMRERCEVLTVEHDTAPKSASIVCQEYHRTLDEITDREVERLTAKDEFPAAWAKMAEGAKRLYSVGDQRWRDGEPMEAAWHVLQEQVNDWHIRLDPALQSSECSDASTDENPIFMGCNWYSPDGTQAFGVSLFKQRLPAGKHQSPWLVTQVDAEVCSEVKE